jgi:uncharacterized protein YlzI (FlbEa/FlbD family)
MPRLAVWRAGFKQTGVCSMKLVALTDAFSGKHLHVNPGDICHILERHEDTEIVFKNGKSVTVAEAAHMIITRAEKLEEPVRKTIMDRIFS